MNNEELMEKISELEQQIKDLKDSINISENEPVEWIPEYGEYYYNISGNGYINRYKFYGTGYDKLSSGYGNCFRTKQRAEQLAKKIRVLFRIERYHDMFCPDYKPDWNNRNEPKFYVYYDNNDEVWTFTHSLIYELPVVYFDSLDTVQKVCNILNNEY